MCGIVGYVGPQEASPLLLEGLRRLEYRGYDSAGIATLSNGGFEVYRSPGQARQPRREALAEARRRSRRASATRAGPRTGVPTEINAHPQTDCTGQIVVVHNGIFENFAERKAALKAAGHRFPSETDTEVFAHEVEAAFQGDLLAAVRAAVSKLTGAYAVARSPRAASPGVLVAARSGPPIVLGPRRGRELRGLGSGRAGALDARRRLPRGRRRRARRRDGRADRRRATGRTLDREVHRILWDAVAAEKGGYRHFMAKEIHEQPTAVAETLGGKVSLETGELYLDSPLLSPERVAGFDRVLLLACGTSWHAAQVGKFLIEGMARHPGRGRLRQRVPLPAARSSGRRTLTIGISQSGETADTVAALSRRAARGRPIGAIVNVPGSQIARMADAVFSTHAGPEIGVASTKAFTTQLAVLFLLAAKLRASRGLGAVLSPEERHALAHLPKALGAALALEPRDRGARARATSTRSDFLFLGRGPPLPGGPRGRAQAQGDLLHPRRGLSRPAR